MRHRRAGLVVLIALLLTACGGHSPRTRVDLKVTYPSIAHRHNESFTLTCQPTGGTLPFADQVCDDIAKHPQAMLHPLPSRSVCLGMVAGPTVIVTTHHNGHAYTFSDQPNCGWPGGTPVGIYWAASQRMLDPLQRFGSLLRCEDDPILLARPTPWRSVFACTHGFWTQHDEHLIRVAEQVWPLRILRPRKLFPHDVGVLPCRITVGGPTTRHITGKCGVSITHAWSTSTLTFTESWASLPVKPTRHSWVVRIEHGRPRVISQSHDAVPQLLE